MLRVMFSVTLGPLVALRRAISPRVALRLIALRLIALRFAEDVFDGVCQRVAIFDARECEVRLIRAIFRRNSETGCFARDVRMQFVERIQVAAHSGPQNARIAARREASQMR